MQTSLNTKKGVVSGRAEPLPGGRAPVDDRPQRALPLGQSPALSEERRGAQAVPLAYHSEQLFGGCDEVVIHHAGITYRLRRTRLGKLIMTR